VSAKIIPLFSPHGRGGGRTVPRARFITERQALADMPDADAKLRGVLEAWRSLRGDSKAPPPTGAMRPEEHLRPLLGLVHVVDCRADKPLDYAFRLFGSSVTVFGERDFTRRRVIDLPDPDWAAKTADDYRQVVQTGIPSFTKIVLQHDYITRRYTRLILPFVDDERQVSRLFVCLNERPLPELGPLPS
jgi:hypothetical protein